MSDSRVQQFVPFKKSGTIVLLKTSTDTLKLLNPNADALMLGDSTHEGGDIKVYRDGSGNLALSFDADAASNAKGLDLYAGVVVQNYLTVGQTTLNTSYPLYINGNLSVSEANVTSIKARYTNAQNMKLNIGVASPDAISHGIKLQIDANDIIVAQATGDGAGGITNKAIGLYGTTPATQAAHIADPAESTAGNNAAIDAILVALENIGIIASS